MATSFRTSLISRAFDEIRDQILSCRLDPGSTIFSQQLALQFGMSRTPVNEALKMLCAEGLVEVIPQVGYVVAPLTLTDVEEIFELRAHEEGYAADLAATRSLDGQLEVFRTKYRAMVDDAKIKDRDLSPDDPRRQRFVADVHDAFHLEVASLAGNRRLLETIRGLLDASRRVRVAWLREQPFPLNWDGKEHAAVVDAILARDRQAAAAHMAHHISAYGKSVLTLLARAGPETNDEIPARRSRRDGQG